MWKIKLLERNIWEYFHEFGKGKDFLNSIQKVLSIKENIEIRFRNILSFCLSKDPTNRVKDKPQNGRRYLKYICQRGSHLEYENYSQIKNKQTIQQKIGVSPKKISKLPVNIWKNVQLY